MHNVERSRMALAMTNYSNATHVATTGHHAHIAGIKLHIVGNFSGVNVDDDSVINLNLIHLFNYFADFVIKLCRFQVK